MMNRRLRERLTEQEILQIFVDVCEGVACMHNLKPALLHRDLKVENILQASDKLYKLCDFGSAATSALKPPSTQAEVRALEQDVLRHTTLQYRAPEMVDPYLRLPIDEKSGKSSASLEMLSSTVRLRASTDLRLSLPPFPPLSQMSGPSVSSSTSYVTTPPRLRSTARWQSSMYITRYPHIPYTPPT